MKPLRILLRIAALSFLFLLLVAFAASQTYPEIRLKDGRVIKEVEVLGYSAASFMAKWQGGRGTVAYINLPDDLRETFEAKKPAQKPAEPARPEAPKEKPTPISEGKLQIGKIDAKAIERSGNYVTYTWQAEIINGTDKPHEVNATIKLFDKDGFELDHDYGEAAYIRAKERGTVTGRSMVTNALWDATTRFRVQIE
jgi:hypothetical protein